MTDPVYPLSIPAEPYMDSAVITMNFVNASSASIYNYMENRARHAGERWVIDASFPPMTREEAEEWIAFGLKLRGSFGTFLFGIPDDFEQWGNASDSSVPKVKGAGQTGYSLVIDGVLPISTAQVWKKGKTFQIGTGLSSRLYKLVEDAATNGSGEVTLNFVPKLRSSPADNADVNFVDPKGLFRRTDSSVSWSVQEGMEYGIELKAIEVVQPL